MPHRVLDNDYAQAGGILSAVGATVTWLLEKISFLSFNDWAQAALTIGGIVYLWYRIKNSRLDAKIKQKELDKD